MFMRNVRPNVDGWFKDFFKRDMTNDRRLTALIRLHYPLTAFGLMGDVLQKVHDGNDDDLQFNLLELIHEFARMVEQKSVDEIRSARLGDRFLHADAASDEALFYHKLFGLTCLARAGRRVQGRLPALRDQAHSMLRHVDASVLEQSKGLLARERSFGLLALRNPSGAVAQWKMASDAFASGYHALAQRPEDDLERCAMARLLIGQRTRFAAHFRDVAMDACGVPEGTYTDLTRLYTPETLAL